MRSKEEIGDEWEDIIKNAPKVSDDAAVLSAALMHINESLLDIRDLYVQSLYTDKIKDREQ